MHFSLSNIISKHPYEYCAPPSHPSPSPLTSVSSLGLGIAYSLNLCQARLGKWGRETGRVFALELRSPILWLPRQVRFGQRLFWDSTLLCPTRWFRNHFCGLAYLGKFLWDVGGVLGYFSPNTQGFEVYPIRSAKPLRWRTFIWRLKFG